MQSTPSLTRTPVQQKELTYHDITLTPDEAEVLCSLTLEKSNELTQLYKDTGEHFSKDSKVSSADTYKQKKYLAKAEAAKKSEDPLFKMSKAYDSVSWYNAIRLALVRINRLLPFIHSPFTRTLFGIAGFGYGIGLLIDIGVVLKPIFKTVINSISKIFFNKLAFPDFNDAQVTLKDRLKNILNKDQRGYRMVNNAVWFGINFAVFLLTGGISIILNLAGWVFDVGQELVKRYYDVKKHEGTLAKIDDKINSIKDEIEFNQDIPEVKEKLLNQLKELDDTRAQLQKKISETKNKWWYPIASAVGVLAGSSAFLLAGELISLIGAGVAFVAGSLFGGFGKKVYDALPSFKSTPKSMPGNTSTQTVMNKLQAEPITKTLHNKSPSQATIKPLTKTNSFNFFSGTARTLADDTENTENQLTQSLSNLSC